MASVGDTGYLIRRAFLVLESCGGTASNDVLIEALFGASAPSAVWGSMLATLLGASKWFEPIKDGWRIAGSDKASEHDYVVLHIETTGLRAARQRIVEIGLRRILDGKEHSGYCSLANPQRALPGYVSRATGITQEMLEEAPFFDEIAEDILEIIGFRPLVAHDIELQLGFLNFELKRCGYRPLVNDRIDIVRLASETVPDLGKPSLERVADRLGVAFPIRRRGESIVDVVAEVYRKICAGELGEGDQVKKSQSAPKNRMGRVVTRPDWLCDIPDTPGVYLMKNATGQVAYVGKAVNLRERVSSYFSLAPSQNRHLDGLLESLERVDVIETGSASEALVLETQLIQEYSPQYNTQKASHVQRPVLRIDFGEAFPRLQTCTNALADDAHYFGPYPNGTIARRVRDYLNYSLKLRTCQRKFDGKKRRKKASCPELSRSTCLAPCEDRVDREQYEHLLRSVASYLGRENSDIVDHLWRNLREALAAQEIVRAAKIKEGIAFLEAVISSQPGPADADTR